MERRRLSRSRRLLIAGGAVAVALTVCAARYGRPDPGGRPAGTMDGQQPSGPPEPAEVDPVGAAAILLLASHMAHDVRLLREAQELYAEAEAAERQFAALLSAWDAGTAAPGPFSASR